jgi:gliding motility-associated-like protein
LESYCYHHQLGWIDDYVFTPNAGSCYSNYTHTVETFDLPQINYVLSDPEITCNVPIVTITASGGVSYLWSDGSSADAFDVSDDLPVSVTVTDNNGCQNDATIVVPMDIQTNAQLVYGTTELNCQTTLIDVSVLGGQSYLWNPNGEVTNEIDVMVPGTYGVDVIFDNGCSQSLSLDITQDTLSPIGVIQNLSGTDELTCNQTSIMLQAIGGLSYQWINGGTNSQQSITQPGMIEVEVTGANFCLDTVSYTLTQDIVPPLVNISATHSAFDCFVDEIALTVSGNAQDYIWANGLGTSITIQCNQSGIYTVTGTALNGCTTTSNIDLPVNRFHPDSLFEYFPFEIWDDNPTITLNGPGQNNIIYHWSLDGVGISDLSDFTFDLPSFNPGEFEICLNAYFSDICQSTFCQTVWVNEALQVYIPTSFTPGYDGVNDGYRPVFSNDNLLEKYQMEIFNRWGQKVFFTDDPNRGWDGNALGTGNYAPDGSYAVIIIYRSVYDEDETVHKGQVTFTR